MTHDLEVDLSALAAANPLPLPPARELGAWKHEDAVQADHAQAPQEVAHPNSDVNWNSRRDAGAGRQRTPPVQEKRHKWDKAENEQAGTGHVTATPSGDAQQSDQAGGKKPHCHRGRCTYASSRSRASTTKNHVELSVSTLND